MEDTKPNIQNSIVRNFSKSRGIDISLVRRIREEKQCQVRKEKRNFKTTIERRKFKIDSNGEAPAQVLEDQLPQNGSSPSLPTGSSSLRQTRQILISRCENLQSENPTTQMEAAVYFRRILAFDRHPPLDAIYENGTVVPRLIQFLSFADNAPLQLEAAWSLTNFACGEAVHVKHLIDNGAVPELFKAILSAKAMNVKEQCLWALSNMSADAYGCDCLTSIPNILMPIMGFIGIVLSPSPAVDTLFPGQQMPLFSAAHTADFKDYPSLSVMRHIAMILGNFIRSKTIQELGLVESIIFAFSDLIQSPDDEVILDICSSLLYVCQLNKADLFHHLFEQGLLSRLKELLEVHYNLLCHHANAKPTLSSSTNNTGSTGESGNNSRTIYEVCLLCLANIARSPVKLHRHSVLLGYSTAPANIFLRCLTSSPAMSPLAHIMEYLHSLFNGITGSASVEGVVPTPTEEVSENNNQDSSMQTEETPAAADSKNAEKRELLVALLSVFETDEQYIVDALSLGVMTVLKLAINNGSYDIKTEAGFCVCAIISIDGSYFDGSTYFEVAGMLHSLLTSNDSHLLMNVLLSLERLFTLAMMHHVNTLQHCLGQLKDAVDFIATHHPLQEIVDIADRIEKLLNVYSKVALE